MSTTKIIIIVLVLVVVIFVIFAAKGAFSSDQPKSGGKADAVKFNKGNKSWAKTINRLMGSMRPKFVLKQKVFPSDPVEIPPDQKNAFRTVTFKLVRGTAHVNYADHTPNAGDELQTQDFNLPDFDNEDPMRGSIVVLKRGGTLTITCTGNTGCRVETVE